MQLHDSLDHAVADVSADLPSLVAASRKQGLSIRRRRRALASVGTAAAVTVLAVGGYTLVPGGAGPSGDNGGVAAQTVDASPLGGQTEPITARGVAAALGSSVEDVADGTVTRYLAEASGGEGSGTVVFRPANGSGPDGQVTVNLQPLTKRFQPPYTCPDYLEKASITDCVVRELPNGDTLRTFSEPEGRGSEMSSVTAEILSPARGLRVVLGATNSNAWAPGEVRDEPVLTTEQLTEIATQPWWSRTQLPAEYVEAGEQLTDFTEAVQGASGS